MRVLVTTDSVGGVWQYTLALLKGLVKNHECRIMLVCIGEEPNEGELREAVPSDGVEVVHLPFKLEWMEGSLRDVRLSIEQVDRLVSQWRPKVVHSNQYCFGALDSGSPVVVVAHSDVFSWFRHHRGAGREEMARVRIGLRDYDSAVRGGLDGATAVVAPSSFAATCVVDLCGRSPVVIHNGLWPESYRIAEKEPFALLAGRLWDEAKGASVAVDGLAGLGLPLRLAGTLEGPSGERMELPPAENVDYLGELAWKDARDIMSRARYYVAASSYEPFGLAALEAAFSGCALVANDIPSFRELWDGAALFYNRGDALDLKKKLTSLLESPDEAARLAALAAQRARASYTADRMAREYYSLYRGI